MRELGKEELRLLLEYVREWNTKPKFSHVAQFVLFQLFNVLPPTEIIEVLLYQVMSYCFAHIDVFGSILAFSNIQVYVLYGSD